MTDQRSSADPVERLSAEDGALLEFEALAWRRAALKEGAIRQRFGCSLARYYLRLNRLIDSPAALAAAPIVVKRLRRRRQAARQSGPGPARVGAPGADLPSGWVP
ncbi:MAG: DUF3263 domain-containing protein [Propionibacteriaceae bacterium]|jgi:hypothetical protein|nr:DUF3263 domain-containing protein [Propionibacteriaceae bacterium]